MKKILYSILFALITFFPINIFAAGSVSVSPSSLTIEQGSKKTFTITAYNAIGDVTISSANSGIASVSTTFWETGMVEEKTTKTGTITVTGNKIGTTTITLNIDAATFDGEELSGQVKKITVNVVSKPSSTQKPTQSTPSKPTTSTVTLSNNNNLKSISINGYELTKINNNNYTLTVSNDVANINVSATAEDSKAKVTGVGTHTLKVGENNIVLIITSESGKQNKINIKVTRKEGYYLEDLESILKNTKIKDADIIINSDTKITKEYIQKIKDSKKIIRFNYYDGNKKLIYSWIINGNKIKEPKEFITTITYIPDNIKEINKLSNYADGLYSNFKHNGELPTGTKIKLYVGDKFESDSIVNVYQYDKDKKELNNIKNNLKVIDGYIEFDIDHCSEYFVTMSIIRGLKQDKTATTYFFMLLSIFELIAIILLIVFYILKVISLKKIINKNKIEEEKISQFNPNVNNNFYNPVTQQFAPNQHNTFLNVNNEKNANNNMK